MARFQVDAVIEDINKAMNELRNAMSGIQVRTAGFKKDHDELARKVADYQVDLQDIAAYIR